MIRHTKKLWDWYPSLFFLVFLAWYFFLMTPLVIVDTKVRRVGPDFVHLNYSYKTKSGLLFCQRKPLDSFLILEDSLGTKVKIPDTSTLAGTGNNDVKVWEVQARIPKILEPGKITVYKDITYSCFGVNKVVLSDKVSFTKD